MAEPFNAQITLSYSGGYYHAMVNVEAADEDTAKAAAQQIVDWLARDRETYWRTEPTAEKEIDFETTKERVRGYARFSFTDEKGEHHRPDVPDSEVGFGTLQPNGAG